MSARQPRLYDSIARKWLALAERRTAHFEELRASGRWRHYYTWEELLDAMREATASRDAWARIAGLDSNKEAAAGREARANIARLDADEAAA